MVKSSYEGLRPPNNGHKCTRTEHSGTAKHGTDVDKAITSLDVNGYRAATIAFLVYAPDDLDANEKLPSKLSASIGPVILTIVEEKMETPDKV